MKAIITQTGMTDNKWAIVELFDKKNGTLGIFKIRCPFNSQKEAVDRAKLISQRVYDEQLELIDETEELTERIKDY